MPNKPKDIIINTRLASDLFTDREEPQKAFWKKYDEQKKNPGGYG